MADFTRRECFTGRTTRFRGVTREAGYSIKRYDISRGEAINDELYREGVDRAINMLPQPAVTPDRPGLALLIRHSGVGAHYVVLAWWDNQNELLTRVLVRDDLAWRDADGRYSFCVWDLEVMWDERNTYVRHVLSPPGGPRPDLYLADHPPF
jgi:hypothetical protein